MNAVVRRPCIPNNSLILLFIKDPAAGGVKSRLAAVLGEEVATELYRNFVLDTLALVEASGIPFQICHYPPDAGISLKQWLGDRFVFQPQAGTDLGERMEIAFQRAFAEGRTRVVLIGSDIPDLPLSVVSGAFRALDGNDAVIGPARDGGYYLVGFRDDTFLPDIFRGIPWSTGTVFADTLAVFEREGRTVHRLSLWRDVDTIDDLKDLMIRSRKTHFSSSRTMAYLAGIDTDLIFSEVRDAKI